jgi:hypothetical protein
LGALLTTSPARAADPALERFVAEVVRKNPGLKARALERDSVRREASAAGIWPDPEVAVMLDNVPEQMGGEMPMVRYQVSQMLMWPGKLSLMEEALTRRAEGKAAGARTREIELIRDAKRAYFMLALNAGLREINRSSRELLTTIVNAAIARYSSGVGGHHEVARSEVERNALTRGDDPREKVRRGRRRLPTVGTGRKTYQSVAKSSSQPNLTHLSRKNLLKDSSRAGSQPGGTRAGASSSFRLRPDQHRSVAGVEHGPLDGTGCRARVSANHPHHRRCCSRVHLRDLAELRAQACCASTCGSRQGDLK